MPMTLRSRRSIHLSQAGGVKSQATPTRSSTRLQGKLKYDEESDEIDSESSQSGVMEGEDAGMEEEAAEEAEQTELKHCRVVLDRVHVDENVLKKELEEKEDMNRKGGKLASRIPTFQKRPVAPSQATEHPAPRLDAPVTVALPAEKAEGGRVEASKAKPAEFRETAPPLPSGRIPRIGSDPPSVGVEQKDDSSVIPGPKSWSFSESVPHSHFIASPRPALRAERDASDALLNEAGVVPDPPPSCLPPENSLSQKSQEHARLTPTRVMRVSVEEDDITKVCSVEAIVDEEPPWRTGLMEVEQRDCRSSSDAEDEDEGEELVKQSEETADDPSCAAAPEEPAPVSSAQSTKSSRRWCLFLLWLLVLGGLGHHFWKYGVPSSVAQLSAQLELHWLEGPGLLLAPCSSDCRVQLVESIPVGLYPASPSGPSIVDSWLRLLDRANSSVHIAAFYFTLQGSDEETTDPSDSQGRKVLGRLKQLQSKGVKLQIAVNAPQTSTKDTAELAAAGAQVREVDLRALTGGVLHTKLWVLDHKHFYLGSANMDWRSLSQVKEVGLSVEDCSCLAQDAFRIFEVYWSIGANSGSPPLFWPARLAALSSADRPLQLKFNGVPARVYLSSAPPQISPHGRADDLATILSVIDDAQKFVYISVMDYLPLSEFTEPPRFWPAIDSDLRAAACTRGVRVRMMVSCWEHSPASMFTFLQSLLVLSRPPLRCNIEVKIFSVPSTPEQRKTPFARVNHAKFMVTDRVVYIGTSNWSENYFTHTAGAGLVVNQTGSEVGEDQQTLQSQAEELFLRDWSSDYASSLSMDAVDFCPPSRR
uniref:PLD phosphodiesterase domain-containing protein n=1 Tax=Nothobranchius furzeri TaxID=105023 RepID=A0A1A8V070_NOTFU